MSKMHSILIKSIVAIAALSPSLSSAYIDPGGPCEGIAKIVAEKQFRSEVMDFRIKSTLEQYVHASHLQTRGDKHAYSVSVVVADLTEEDGTSLAHAMYEVLVGQGQKERCEMLDIKRTQ